MRWMPLLNRRRALFLLGAGGLGLVGARFGLPWLMRPGPVRPLGGETLAFVERCFEGLDRRQIWDTHVHVIGLGGGGTGCWINPAAQSHLHPIRRLQYDVYRSALGMQSDETADADYVERLFAMHRLANPDGMLVLMGFDMVVDPDGRENRELSPFYTPNDYVLRLARERDDAVACVSIHPYRADAVERLDAAVEAGARAVKWLPNSQGIDPGSAACEPFYRRLAETELPLISHGGREYAATAAHAQEYGNPLLLRRALDAGVKVVVAHCAGFGRSQDLDLPAGQRRDRPSFELFLRLMNDARYDGMLFGDISAVTALNRSGRALRQLIRARELHPRLVNGSDYPMPALGFLFSPAKLQYEGYLDDEERRVCSRVQDANPLLFDFVVKRSLKVTADGRVHRFAPGVFQTSWLFRRTADSRSEATA